MCIPPRRTGDVHLILFLPEDLEERLASLIPCLFDDLHDRNTCFFWRFQLFFNSPRPTFKSSLSSNCFSILLAASSKATDRFHLSSTSISRLSFQACSSCDFFVFDNPPIATCLRPAALLILPSHRCQRTPGPKSTPPPHLYQLFALTVVYVLLHPCNSPPFLSTPLAFFLPCRRRALLRQRRPYPSFGARRSLCCRSLVHVSRIAVRPLLLRDALSIVLQPTASACHSVVSFSLSY